MEEEIDVDVSTKSEIYRRGTTRELAKDVLRTRLYERGGEIVLKNANDGDVARLNMGTVGKLVSDPAVKNSTNNGFAKEQHYAVAADIDNIYNSALKLWSHGDADGNPDIAAFHRYATPLHFDDAVALVTVKESVRHGRKIYALEVLEIKRLEDVLDELRKHAHTHQSSPSDTSPTATVRNGDRPSSTGSSGIDISSGTETTRRYGLSPTSTAPELYTKNIRDLISKVNTQSQKNKNNSATPQKRAENADTDTPQNAADSKGGKFGVVRSAP